MGIPHETPPFFPPCYNRRTVLQAALGLGVMLPGRHQAAAQDTDPRNLRPQAGDQFVFLSGEPALRLYQSPLPPLQPSAGGPSPQPAGPAAWRPTLARPPLPRRRAGGPAGGGAWTTGWAQQAGEKPV
jgi:hypothetical protein